MRDSLLKSGIWLSVGILAGRAAGFVREGFLAGTYGVGEEAGIAVLMLTVPDLLVNVLMGGAMAAALIPEFKRYTGLRGACLFTQASALVGGGFFLLAAVLAIFADALVMVFAPGLGPLVAARAADALRMAIWVIPLTTLAGVTTAYLQANGRFAIPAFGSFIFNIVLIAGLAAVALLGGGLQALAAFVIAGAALRLLSQLARLPRVVLRPRALGLRLVSRQLAIRYFQALAAGSMLLLFPVFARAIASFRDAGALAVMNYASKLVEFPLGIAITVFSVLLFPRLAECFASSERTEAGSRTLRQGVTAVTIVAFAMMVSMGWFSGALASLAFGHGKVPAAAVAEIAALAGIGLLALPAQGVSSLLVAAFNAQRDTRTPLVINSIGLLGFVVGGGFAFGMFGLMGLMAAQTAAHYSVAVLQGVALYYKSGISVIDAVVSAEIARAVVVMAIVFAPFVALSSSLSGAMAGSFVAGLSVVTLIAASVFTHAGYRSEVFRRMALLAGRAA